MSDFRHIIQNIVKKNFAPVYILYGAESYYVDKIVESLENNVVEDSDKEFDQSVIYGAEASAGIVMEAAGQLPMWSDRRLVVLKEAQAMARAKTELDKLASYIEKPNVKTVLCIAFKGEDLKATSALMKAAKKNMKVIVFDSPKIKEWKLGEVIKDYCGQNNIQIEEKGIELLISNIGSSLSNIFSEIEKLIVALGANQHKISADLVAHQIGVSKEFNNFELVSALARKDYYQTLKIFKHFEENPKSNPILVIVSNLFNFFQRLLLATFNEDKSDKALMDALQLKNQFALKEIRVGLQNYNAMQTINAIHAIRSFDTRSKGIYSFQKDFPLLQELLLTLLTL